MEISTYLLDKKEQYQMMTLVIVRALRGTAMVVIVRALRGAVMVVIVTTESDIGCHDVSDENHSTELNSSKNYSISFSYFCLIHLSINLLSKLSSHVYIFVNLFRQLEFFPA
jgi:uncharacterized membrane protein